MQSRDYTNAEMEKNDSNVKHEHFLTRLQQLDFASAGMTDPSLLADCYRNMFLHISYLQGLSPETKEMLKKYAFIADKMDATGLNNFAEGAMALCSYHKNESTKWQSSLCNPSFMSGLQIATNEEFTDTDDDVILTLPNLRQNTASSSSDQASLKLSTGDALFSPGLNQCRGANGSNAALNVCYGSIRSPTNGSNAAPNVGYGTFRSLNEKSAEPPRTNSSNQTGSYSRNAGWQVPAVSDTTSSAFCPGNITEGPYANFGQKRKASSSLYVKTPVGNRPKEDLEEDEEVVGKTARCGPFKTAKQQLVINQMKKGNDRSCVSEANYGAVKKSLGTRRGPAAKFIPPVLNQDSEDDGQYGQKSNPKQTRGIDGNDENVVVDERLKGIDPKMIELINNEIMDHGALITWSDIAGLEFAKKTIKEIVVWPMLRPDIFVGLRGPPKGLLLFGPPGTGKTLIGKCIASQSKSTFFSISASSLTSKWVGEGEKMVRALFAVARCHQPAVVFIDEIDSLLSQRSDSEHESSRRIKTEFLVQLDGASTQSEDRLLVIGATNRPHEIDEAARRRFVKRLLIPLPEPVARQQIVTNLMAQQKNSLSEIDIEAIVKQTDGYSGADMTNLCREAALGPIRSIPFEDMEIITPDQVRPIMYEDFEAALCQVRASVSSKDLQLYTEWNRTYGSFGH